MSPRRNRGFIASVVAVSWALLVGASAGVAPSVAAGASTAKAADSREYLFSQSVLVGSIPLTSVDVTADGRVVVAKADGEVVQFAGANTPTTWGTLGVRADGVAVDPQGNAWVASAAGTATGEHLAKVTPTGEVSWFALGGQAKAPTRVDVAADGSIWIADPVAGAIFGVDQTGTLTTTLRATTAAFAPHDLVVAGDGSIFAVDATNQTVTQFRAGAQAAQWSGDFGGQAISVNPEGELVVLKVNAGNEQLYRYTPQGTLINVSTLVWGPTTDSLVDVSISALGTAYVVGTAPQGGASDWLLAFRLEQPGPGPIAFSRDIKVRQRVLWTNKARTRTKVRVECASSNKCVFGVFLRKQSPTGHGLGAIHGRTLTPGETKRYRIRLTPRARKFLRKNGRVRIQAMVYVDSDDKTVKKVTLRAK